MKRTFKRLGTALVAVLTLATTASCERQCMNDNPVEVSSVTLEDVLNEGVVVNFSFNLDGEDYVVSFMKVGDEYIIPVRNAGGDYSTGVSRRGRSGFPRG